MFSEFYSLLSDFSQSLSVVVRVLLWTFCLVKTYEIGSYIRWLIKSGKDYREEILKLADGENAGRVKMEDLYKLDQKYKTPWPLPWQLERWIRHRPAAAAPPVSLRFVFGMNRFVGRWIHRQPGLVFALALVLVSFPDQSRFLWVEICLTLTLIFLELLDLLCARAYLGFADNFRYDFDIDPNRFHSEDLMPWSKSDFIGKFLFGIHIFLATSIFAFAAIYYRIYQLVPNSFCGIHKSDIYISPWIQFLYFSITTFATVGYGDITPIVDTAQVIVALEVIFGIEVIVFLLFALSNTFRNE